jgi:hypothetical protein
MEIKTLLSYSMRSSKEFKFQVHKRTIHKEKVGDQKQIKYTKNVTVKCRKK